MVGRGWGEHGLFFDLNWLRAGDSDSKSRAGCRWERHGGEVWASGLGQEVG